MFRLTISLSLLLIVGGCGDKGPPKIHNDRLAEGFYTTPGEISGFSGTLLELKDGRFRYWFYSDIRGPDEPEYPIEGDYDFQDGKVLLNDSDVNRREWFVDVVNGTPVLWRDDALKAWKQEQKIYDYGVLIWAGDELPEGDLYQYERPSVRTLYSEEKKRTVKEWKDPFVHGPQ